MENFSKDEDLSIYKRETDNINVKMKPILILFDSMQCKENKCTRISGVV